MKISKNKKMRFFLMSQGSLNLKIRLLGEKVCSVACVQTHTKVTTEGTLSGFREFFLQPIIKDRPNTVKNIALSIPMISTPMKPLNQTMTQRGVP